eukprot:Em0013g13a
MVWTQLNKQFIGRLNQEGEAMATKIETNILKLYLITATRQNKPDEVKAFFEKNSDSLQYRKEWKDWFALPFTKNPEEHSVFKMYYSKECHTSLQCSLTIAPGPALLKFELEHQKIQAIETENHLLHDQLASTKTSLAEAEATVQSLEARLTQAVANAAKKKSSSIPITSNKTSSLKKQHPSSSSQSMSAQQHASGGDSSGPSVSPVKARETCDSGWVFWICSMTLSTDTREDTPSGNNSELSDPLSPSSVVDEGHVKVIPIEPSGATPFLPIDHAVYSEHGAPVTHCRFAPSATKVASCDLKGVVRSTFSTIDTKSTVLSFDWVTQDGDNLLLLGGNDGLVKLYDVSSQSQPMWDVCTPEPKFQSSTHFAISAANGGASHTLPSGQLHVSSGGVYIFDLKTRKMKGTVLGTPQPIAATNCLALNHNSNLLVTGGVDGIVRLFDVQQNKALFAIKAHSLDVMDVQFSWDETSIYSVGSDGKFCCWSIYQSGLKMAEYGGSSPLTWPPQAWHTFPEASVGRLFAFGKFGSEDKYVLTCAPQEAAIYQVSY